VLAAIEDRDRRDRGRAVGPLRVPGGATVIDTSDMDIAQVTERMLQYARAPR